MKITTNRLLVLSILLTPGIALAKPAPKKRPAKPAPAAAAPVEAAPPPPPHVAHETAAASPSYSAGYGMAGCGFGAYVVKEDSIMQVFAATTNSTVWSQSLGISFGTLNCQPSHKAVAAEQKVFIEANLVSLKREAVTGQGETLTAFADLLGCQAERFSQVSKDNYQQIYQASEADAILQGYKAVLTTQCTRLI